MLKMYLLKLMIILNNFKIEKVMLQEFRLDLRDLDRMTAGFQRNDLIIVAARPSVGKTAFALNIAQNVA